MSRTILACLVSLLAVGTVRAQPADNHAPFDREARISISAEGKVTALTFVNTGAEKDVLGARLEPLIRSWSFEPGQLDGKPATTQTTLFLHLDMRKDGADAYAVTLLGTDTGMGWGTFAPPPYPKPELMNGDEARLSLLITVSADGSPLDIRVEKIRSTGSAGARTEFSKAAIEAAKHWTFVPETVGNRGLTGVVRVPVDFCINGQECRKLAGDPALPARQAAGSVGTLESHAKLVTQVAGTTL